MHPACSLLYSIIVFPLLRVFFNLLTLINFLYQFRTRQLLGQSTSQQKINHPKTLKGLEVVDFYFAAIMYEITTFRQDSLCHKTESIPCHF